MNGPPDMNAPPANLPPDDLRRRLAVARLGDEGSLVHVGVVGDTYTILLSGNDTGGRYCLIVMLIPPGGGPGPHRHEFEESFTVLEGEIEVTFRGAQSVVRTGDTINIPANAPHFFHNRSAAPARLLCICAPAGNEEFLTSIGERVATRTSVPAKLDAQGQADFIAKAQALAPRYRTELLPPP